MEQVIFFSLIGGMFSLIGGLLLLQNKKSADLLAVYATPFAAGVLLAAAFTDLLPEALQNKEAKPILIATLGGILFFFLLEKFLRFFHHHHEHGAKEKTSSSLIIIGDTLHNALDGIAIGAAFLISPSAGIVATIAVAAHEIPQEIGDFGLLLRNGMKKRDVLIVNIISALATTFTAVVTFSLGTNDSGIIPFLLAITAGFFIYIATSDIIPEIHEKLPNNQRDFRPYLLLIGVAFVLAVSPIAHKFVEPEHEQENTENNQYTENIYYDE